MPNYRARPGLIVLLALLAGAVAPTAHAERRLSLREAAELALARNPELRLEEAKVPEADARRLSTRGLYFPRLSTDANLMVSRRARDGKR